MASIVRKIIFTAKAPPPIGPYSQAVLVDKTLYISGQIGMDTKGELTPGGIEAQTRKTLDNMGEILKAAGVSYNNVVKTTVLLSDMANFQTVNKIYGEYFKEPHPARAAYQVVALPKNALVEIEAVAAVDGNLVDSRL